MVRLSAVKSVCYYWPRNMNTRPAKHFFYFYFYWPKPLAVDGLFATD